MKARLVLVMAILSIAVPANSKDVPSGGACLPYGEDYAFMIGALDGWSSACHVEQTYGVTVALWPTTSNWPDASQLMYVTVSKKAGESLDQFIEEDLQVFRKGNANGKIEVVPDSRSATGTLLPTRFTSGLTNGRYEAIAYAEQASVFLIFGFTAKTEKAFQSGMPAFKQLIKNYTPIDKVKHIDNAHSS